MYHILLTVQYLFIYFCPTSYLDRRSVFFRVTTLPFVFFSFFAHTAMVKGSGAGRSRLNATSGLSDGSVPRSTISQASPKTTSNTSIRRRRFSSRTGHGSSIAAKEGHEADANALEAGVNLLERCVTALRTGCSGTETSHATLNDCLAQITSKKRDFNSAEVLSVMSEVIDERSRPSLEYVLGVLGIDKLPTGLEERQRSIGAQAFVSGFRNRSIRRKRDALQRTDVIETTKAEELKNDDSSSADAHLQNENTVDLLETTKTESLDEKHIIVSCDKTEPDRKTFVACESKDNAICIAPDETHEKRLCSMSLNVDLGSGHEQSILLGSKPTPLKQCKIPPPALEIHVHSGSAIAEACLIRKGPPVIGSSSVKHPEDISKSPSPQLARQQNLGAIVSLPMDSLSKNTRMRTYPQIVESSKTGNRFGPAQAPPSINVLEPHENSTKENEDKVLEISPRMKSATKSLSKPFTKDTTLVPAISPNRSKQTHDTNPEQTGKLDINKNVSVVPAISTTTTGAKPRERVLLPIMESKVPVSHISNRVPPLIKSQRRAGFVPPSSTSFEAATDNAEVKSKSLGDTVLETSLNEDKSVYRNETKLQRQRKQGKGGVPGGAVSPTFSGAEVKGDVVKKSFKDGRYEKSNPASMDAIRSRKPFHITKNHVISDKVESLKVCLDSKSQAVPETFSLPKTVISASLGTSENVAIVGTSCFPISSPPTKSSASKIPTAMKSQFHGRVNTGGTEKVSKVNLPSPINESNKSRAGPTNVSKMKEVVSKAGGLEKDRANIQKKCIVPATRIQRTKAKTEGSKPSLGVEDSKAMKSLSATRTMKQHASTILPGDTARGVATVPPFTNVRKFALESRAGPKDNITSGTQTSFSEEPFDNLAAPVQAVFVAGEGGHPSKNRPSVYGTRNAAKHAITAAIRTTGAKTSEVSKSSRPSKALARLGSALVDHNLKKTISTGRTDVREIVLESPQECRTRGHISSNSSNVFSPSDGTVSNPASGCINSVGTSVSKPILRHSQIHVGKVAPKKVIQYEHSSKPIVSTTSGGLHFPKKQSDASGLSEKSPPRNSPPGALPTSKSNLGLNSALKQSGTQAKIPSNSPVKPGTDKNALSKKGRENVQADNLAKRPSHLVSSGESIRQTSSMKETPMERKGGREGHSELRASVPPKGKDSPEDGVSAAINVRSLKDESTAVRKPESGSIIKGKWKHSEVALERRLQSGHGKSATRRLEGKAKTIGSGLTAKSTRDSKIAGCHPDGAVNEAKRAIGNSKTEELNFTEKTGEEKIKSRGSSGKGTTGSVITAATCDISMKAETVSNTIKTEAVKIENRSSRDRTSATRSSLPEKLKESDVSKCGSNDKGDDCRFLDAPSGAGVSVVVGGIISPKNQKCVMKPGSTGKKTAHVSIEKIGTQIEAVRVDADEKVITICERIQNTPHKRKEVLSSSRTRSTGKPKFDKASKEASMTGFEVGERKAPMETRMAVNAGKKSAVPKPSVGDDAIVKALRDQGEPQAQSVTSKIVGKEITVGNTATVGLMGAKLATLVEGDLSHTLEKKETDAKKQKLEGDMSVSKCQTHHSLGSKKNLESLIPKKSLEGKGEDGVIASDLPSPEMADNENAKSGATGCRIVGEMDLEAIFGANETTSRDDSELNPIGKRGANESSGDRSRMRAETADSGIVSKAQGSEMKGKSSLSKAESVTERRTERRTGLRRSSGWMGAVDDGLERSGHRRLRRESVNLRDSWAVVRGDLLFKDDLLMQECVNVWATVNKAKISIPFRDPVLAKHAPNYFDIVKEPMDLSTVRMNLEQKKVDNPRKFYDQMMLICRNAMLYNDIESDIYGLAVELQQMIRKYTKPVVRKWLLERRKEGTGASSESSLSSSSSDNEGHVAEQASLHRPQASSQRRKNRMSGIDRSDSDDDGDDGERLVRRRAGHSRRGRGGSRKRRTSAGGRIAGGRNVRRRNLRVDDEHGEDLVAAVGTGSVTRRPSTRGGRRGGGSGRGGRRGGSNAAPGVTVTSTGTGVEGGQMRKGKRPRATMGVSQAGASSIHGGTSSTPDAGDEDIDKKAPLRKRRRTLSRRRRASEQD